MFQNASLPVASSRDQIISKMDAFVEDPCKAPMLRKMTLLYIRIAWIRSMFLSSLPLVYLFLSLNVCFLEPFLTADCCPPAKRAVLMARKT